MTQSCDHCCTRIERLGVKIGDETILKGIDLHINCGELVAVIGPNGAGKTTLLRAILGEVPYSGSIHFKIKNESGRDPAIGYVPQKLNFEASTPLTVLDFVVAATGREPVWFRIGPKARDAAVKVLARVKANHLENRRLGDLSGGELQRVLLAVAMMPVPDLLLLDEPVSGVDPKGLSLFYEIVSDLRKKHDVSIIMVTHDLAGIAPHADRLVLINRSVIADGAPREVLADDKLVQALGPILWNISALPGELSGSGRKRGN
jgi:zinc transport system ATP-binding protein